MSSDGNADNFGFDKDPAEDYAPATRGTVPARREESQDFLLRFADRAERIRDVAEQTALFERYIKKGDLAARDRIIGAHARFAMLQVSGLTNYGIPEDTLKAESIIALSKAIERFDYTQGIKFISYIARPIKGHLQKFILAHHNVPNATHYQSMFFTLGLVQSIIKNKNPDATPAELERLLLENYSRRTKTNVRAHHLTLVQDKLAEIGMSLDKTISEDSSLKLIDMQPSLFPTPEELMENEQNSLFARAFLNAAMSGMTQLQRQMVEFMHLGHEEMTLTDAATHLNLSKADAIDMHDDIMRTFHAAASSLDPQTFNYQKIRELPAASGMFADDDHLRPIDRVAREKLTPADYFIFSSIHLQRGLTPISLSDIGEALDITLAEAKTRLSAATLAVLESISEGTFKDDLALQFEKNISLNKGRDIPGTPFSEAHIDRADPETIALYDAAWNLFDKKEMTARELYVLCANCLYVPHQRKTLPTIGAHFGVSQQATYLSLKSAKEKLKAAFPHLSDSPVFGNKAEFQRKSKKQAEFDQILPAIPVENLDLSTPERQVVYETARACLTPYRLFVLSHHCFMHNDHRLTSGAIARLIPGQTDSNIRLAISAARHALRDALPERYKDTTILNQKVSVKGRKGHASLDVIPDVEKSHIDYTDDDAIEIMAYASKILSPYEHYCLIAHRFYAADQRLTVHEIAKSLIAVNPTLSGTPIQNLADRVRVAISKATTSLRAGLPDAFKNSHLLENTPPRSRKIAQTMGDTPKIPTSRIVLTTPEHKKIYAAVQAELNPLQQYVITMYRLVRPAHRMFMSDIAAITGKPLGTIRMALSSADQRIIEYLPENLINSPILQQEPPKYDPGVKPPMP